MISTHTPLAGRDFRLWLQYPGILNFYSHAPRGARRRRSKTYPRTSSISTHTPLAGRDISILLSAARQVQFLLTRPSRGATLKSSRLCRLGLDFYSHAPRGARLTIQSCIRIHLHFYSHAPRGARPGATLVLTNSAAFLLTRPSRGATWLMPWGAVAALFLLTRPSRGATISTLSLSSTAKFLLTRPSRGETFTSTLGGTILPISTHTPLAGRDLV